MALKYLDRIIDQELSKSIEIWSVRRKHNENKKSWKKSVVERNRA